MSKHTDHKGDVFDVTEQNGRVTVMSGPSVVMDAMVHGKQLTVLRAHSTAPSPLFVLRALGRAEPAKVEPEPVEPEKPSHLPKPPTKRRRPKPE